MTVNFEEKDNKGIITFEIPQETVKHGLDYAFNRLKANLNVPGFRKGKVPRKIFNNIYGEEALYDEALNHILPSAYEEAVAASGRADDIYGQPEMDIKSLGKNEAWVLEATVSLKPQVNLGDYKSLEVEKQETEVSEEEVNEAIEKERQNLAELVLKETAAESGDTVVIDYSGSIDGVKFDGGTAENHSLVLGSGSFIPGFEDQLIGAEPGAEVEVTVTFPEEYHAEELAGKEAIFETKVHEIKIKQLPELDDDFAQDVDDEVESLEELKNKKRVQLEEAKAAQAKEIEEDEALRQAVENAEIVGGVPYDMVHEEIHRQMDYFLNNLSRQGINPELYYQITGSTEADLHQQFEVEAELRTKTNLVLEAIAKAENIEVTDAEIQEEIEALAAQYGIPAENVRNFVTEDMLASDVKMKKAMSTIIDTKVQK